MRRKNGEMGEKTRIDGQLVEKVEGGTLGMTEGPKGRGDKSSERDNRREQEYYISENNSVNTHGELWRLKGENGGWICLENTKRGGITWDFQRLDPVQLAVIAVIAKFISCNQYAVNIT